MIEEIKRNLEKIGERNLKKVLHGPKWSLETCRARTSYLENVYRGTIDDVGWRGREPFFEFFSPKLILKQELELRRNKKIGERNLQQ